MLCSGLHIRICKIKDHCLSLTTLSPVSFLAVKNRKNWDLILGASDPDSCAAEGTNLDLKVRSDMRWTTGRSKRFKGRHKPVQRKANLCILDEF